MKIALVNPDLGIWIKSKTIPLGLAYVAASLEKAGHEVIIIDRNIYLNQKIPDDIQIVGTTATTPVVPYAWEVLEEAKKLGMVTMIGGPHVTCLPDESAALSYVDYVIRGEGEETVVELVDFIEKKLEPKGVLGVTYKNSEGVLVKNPERPFITDLDSIPFPAYHLFPDLNFYTHPQPLLGTKTPSASIITSRGCMYKCNFCYKGTFGSTWRYRSPENILAEWEMLVKKYKVKEIAIQDDIYNTNIKRVNEISDLIIERNLVVPWTTPNGIRADHVNDEFFHKLKKSGCYRVSFGIESGDQEVLDKIINKHIKLDKIINAIKLAKKHKIKTLGFFVLGNPFETEEQMKRSIDFSLNTGLDFAQYTNATPFPGTGLYQEVIANGKMLIKDWREYSQFNSVAYFEHKGINAELTNKLIKAAYRKFYVRPRIIFNFATDINTWMNLKNVFSAAIHFLIKGK
jgi:radical SAM superfamily enzyme YgiQ (UPF0313 family)